MTLDDAKRTRKPPPNVVSTQNVSRLRRPTGPQRAAMRALSDNILRNAREVQLDWCIDDLTPATFYECGPGLLLESSTDSEGEADAADAAEVLAIL